MTDLDPRIEQLTSYWAVNLCPGLQGLDDVEYRWSPPSQLAAPLGPPESWFAEAPMSSRCCTSTAK